MNDKMVVSRQTEVRDESRAFEAIDLASAVQISTLVAESKLFKGISTPAAAFVVLATGRELGLTAMQSLRGIHMIDGKPSLSADVCVAVVLHSPACLFFRLVESTNAIATYETQRRGDAVRRMSFSVQDAQAAGLAGKDNWRHYPAAMLRARAAMALARAIYPDALMGVYDPDELGEHRRRRTTCRPRRPRLRRRLTWRPTPRPPSPPASPRPRTSAGSAAWA